MTTTVGDDLIPVLPFRIGEEGYALPVSDVVEVAAMLAVTPVPGSHDALLGMVNRQGSVLPVLDLRLIFQADAAVIDASTLFIVAEYDNQRAGLVVDEVFQVKYIMKERTASGTAAGRYIQQVVSDTTGLLQIVALDALLTQHLFDNLSGIKNA
ncbi:MAG: chemotaxis protein CheW [Aggregatilineales bacterium]